MGLKLEQVVSITERNTKKRYFKPVQLISQKYQIHDLNRDKYQLIVTKKKKLFKLVSEVKKLAIGTLAFQGYIKKKTPYRAIPYIARIEGIYSVKLPLAVIADTKITYKQFKALVYPAGSTWFNENRTACAKLEEEVPWYDEKLSPQQRLKDHEPLVSRGQIRHYNFFFRIRHNTR